MIDERCRRPRGRGNSPHEEEEVVPTPASKEVVKLSQVLTCAEGSGGQHPFPPARRRVPDVSQAASQAR